MQLVLTPELVLEAYRHGLFPMAYAADSAHINWICPEMRGQLSIEGIHIPRRLIKTIRSGPYEVRVDADFSGVIAGCGAAREGRPETWINDSIRDVFCDLHAQGYAHSVECWQGGELVGGLYGLVMGGAFFGESMFSTARDASKVALIHLVARLWKGGFVLLDTQFTNDHLAQFGVYDVPYDDYKAQLKRALAVDADFVLPDICERDLVEEYLDFRKSADGASSA